MNFRLFRYLLGQQAREEFHSAGKSRLGATLLSLAVTAFAVFVAVTATVRIPREYLHEAWHSGAIRADVSHRSAAADGNLVIQQAGGAGRIASG